MLLFGNCNKKKIKPAKALNKSYIMFCRLYAELFFNFISGIILQFCYSYYLLLCKIIEINRSSIKT